MSEDKKKVDVTIKIKGISFNTQSNLKRKPKKDKEEKNIEKEKSKDYLIANTLKIRILLRGMFLKNI